MEELRSFFWNAFHMPLSKLSMPDETLLMDLGGGLLWGTEIADRKIYFVQGDINTFIKSRRLGYFLIGYWGHGANSYAFYYCRIDEWSHVFFRLGYGGIYSDKKAEAVRVRRFLKNWFAFEPELRSKTKSIIAVDSMGYGEYRFRLNNGKLVKLNESLHWTGNFKETFAPLF